MPKRAELRGHRGWILTAVVLTAACSGGSGQPKATAPSSSATAPTVGAAPAPAARPQPIGTLELVGQSAPKLEVYAVDSEMARAVDESLTIAPFTVIVRSGPGTSGALTAGSAGTIVQVVLQLGMGSPAVQVTLQNVRFSNVEPVVIPEVVGGAGQRLTLQASGGTMTEISDKPDATTAACWIGPKAC